MFTLYLFISFSLSHILLSKVKVNMLLTSLIMYKLLLLLGAVIASPVLETRQIAYGDKSALLRQNTTDAITFWMEQASVNGMTVVITTPDRDEILSFGQSDNKGGKVTEDVCLLAVPHARQRRSS
jgi:hypothetical protein